MGHTLLYLSPSVVDISHACVQTKYKIKFGQIYLSKPNLSEADGSTSVMCARVRVSVRVRVCMHHAHVRVPHAGACVYTAA